MSKVLTGKEYQKKVEGKSSIPFVGEKSPRQGSLPRKEEKLYVLQDPESRSFEDVIKVNGKDKQRIVRQGILKTTDEVLARFHLDKGWLLLPVDQ